MTLYHTNAPGQRLVTGAIVEVGATGLADSGAGIGEVAAAGGPVTVHVAGLLPGERALARVEHVSPHRRQAWAHIDERLGEHAAERVPPACPGHGACGGCVWQHLSYAGQLLHKRRRVVQACAAYERLAGIEVAAVSPAARVLHYRNVGKYVAGPARDAEGGLTLGSYAPRSHRVVDGTGCRVVAPNIEAVRAHAAVALASLPVYDEQNKTGWLRYLVLRQGVDDRVLATVVTRSSAERASVTEAAHRLAEHPRVAGIVWLRNDRANSSLLDGTWEPVCGRSTAAENVAGVEIELGVRDFFQVNRAQARELYREVARQAGFSPDEPSGDGARAGDGASAQVIVDLFCGVGGIAFTLARAAAQANRTCRILGIERSPDAVRAAERAAERAGLSTRLWFQSAPAVEVVARVRAWCAAIGRPGSPPADSAIEPAGDSAVEPAGDSAVGLVVVNPPRKGLQADTVRALVELEPRRIIYVSCGPVSLARDLDRLIDGGYRVDVVQPIDLMPGTPQIETVVGLTREAPGRVVDRP